MDINNIDFRSLFITLGVVAGISLLLAAVFFGWVFWRIRHIQLPPNADFFEALRLTPLSVVILLDLLDMSLDFFSAPISWVILNRLGLLPLRAVTMVQSFIPGTQILPTMTVAWILSRVMRHPPRFLRHPY
jgi:hypothetical protein